MKSSILNSLFVTLLIAVLVTTGCTSSRAEVLTTPMEQPPAVQEPVSTPPAALQVTEVPYSSAEIFFEYSKNTDNAVIGMQYLNGTVDDANLPVGSSTPISGPVNGIILQPGEIFSYNQVIGERTLARYFVWGKDINNKNTVGGGVCRLATVIYQAARYGGFKIIERWPHSKPVHYAKRGWDATVQYGALDFKFQNTGCYPIKIYGTSTPQKNGVLVKINIVCLVSE
ncbi:MAG: VanW family protein [Ignavibacteriales bacterium]